MIRGIRMGGAALIAASLMCVTTPSYAQTTQTVSSPDRAEAHDPEARAKGS